MGNAPADPSPAPIAAREIPLLTIKRKTTFSRAECKPDADLTSPLCYHVRGPAVDPYRSKCHSDTRETTQQASQQTVTRTSFIEHLLHSSDISNWHTFV
jgi:hypothetical protein